MDKNTSMFALIFHFVLYISLAVAIEEIMADCAQKHSINQTTLQTMRRIDLAVDENDMNQKCFVYCLFNEVHLIDENYNLQMPILKQIAVDGYQKLSPEDAEAVVEKCAIRNETDPCDKTYNFYQCHVKLYKKLTGEEHTSWLE